ncbi:TetR/AcrR family transcriptional regulator [Pinirhizobacter sp.]|uniref:TetR/AcrR family transcriptional regulator n=1 Tax=Pinirhizobacter sp. TaxID=2950432 RepID=UPI002F3EF121
MADPDNTREPRQQRSRETLQRLLVAALEVLDAHGLAGATIPRIAATAGMAPSSIYRRFADKDALLRAAFLHILKRVNQSNRDHLPDLVVRDTLAGTVHGLVGALVAQYREHAAFLRALLHYFDTDTDTAFLEEARAIVRDNIRLVAATLLAHRAEIRHDDTECAACIAVLSATSTIESATLDPRQLWTDWPQMTDAQLIDEVSRICVGYLCGA